MQGKSKAIQYTRTYQIFIIYIVRRYQFLHFSSRFDNMLLTDTVGHFILRNNTKFTFI